MDLNYLIDLSFRLGSRIHRLHTYIAPLLERKVFIKRDDELGSGICGSKYRKFASLIPFLKNGNFDEVIAIGGSNSANIACLLQICTENKIPLKLFLLKSHTARPKGNELWINLLKDKSEVVQISREDWPNVNQLAEEYASSQTGKNFFIISEGCAIKEVLPGAMTLGTEILDHESASSIFFNHIFIDSGTGTTAAGLLLGLSVKDLGARSVHITLIAGTEEEFERQLLRFSNELDVNVSGKIRRIFHKPAIARSFGAINSQVLEETAKIARLEGILMDPVYSVKHLYTAKQVIEGNNLTGNILFIYSGSALGLAGFQEELADL